MSSHRKPTWGSALPTLIAVTLSILVGCSTVSAASFHVAAGTIGGAASTIPDPYPLSGPTNVAIDESTGGGHDLYVTDPGHARIEKFDSEGHFLLMFGKEVDETKVQLKASESEQNVCTAASGDVCQTGTTGSEGKGEFLDPQYVAVDNSLSTSHGDVYVGDEGTDTVYKFAANGTYISANDGAAATGGPFGGIDGVTVDTEGKLWVFDPRGFVFRFAADGTPLDPFFDTRNGAKPVGIAVEADGAFYTVEGTDALEKYAANGVMIGRVTSSPTDNGTLPTGVALDVTTSDLYVDLGSEIGHILPGCDPSLGQCPFADSFGFSSLHSGRGLAADSSDNEVFAADATIGLVDRFSVGLEASTAAADEISASEATLHATVNPEGTSVSECDFEYGPNEEYGQSIPCQETVGGGNLPVSVHADLHGLKGGTTYHYRVFAGSSSGVLRAEDRTFTTLPTAVIEAVSAKNITASTTELVARINPAGLDTRYRFEYGTTTNYGISIPVPDRDIGAGNGGVEIAQILSALSPNTTYHYRIVATDTNGSTESSDHTFVFLLPEHVACQNETLRAGLSTNLPDCRGYELVTPVQKNGALIGAILFGPSFPAIAEDGSSLIVPSVQCFAGAESCIAHRSSEGQLYEFSRRLGGWSTNPLAPPASEFQTESIQSYGANPDSFLFSAPGASGTEAFYARQQDGSYRLIGPLGEPGTEYNVLLGSAPASSADFSHLVYGTEHSVWPFDPTKPLSHSLYEYTSVDDTAPTLVGVTGGPGSTDLIGTCGTDLGGGTGGSSDAYNPLSADGRIVYFTPRQCNTGSGVNTGKEVPALSLYERIDGSRTVPISFAMPASCTTPECHNASPADATFEGASQDGEAVLFTSTQKLTDGASQDRQSVDDAYLRGGCLKTVASASGCNLYLSECPSHCEDPSQRKLLDLSETAVVGEGPRVLGLVALSPDASDVFFVAKGLLTTTKNKRGEGAQAGGNNLYLYQRGTNQSQGRLSFVARLSQQDQPNWANGFRFQGTAGAIPSQGLGFANITPDGRYLVFTSTRALTADASSGAAQVYRYDSQTEEMTRISVGEAGFNDNGNAGNTGADASIVPSSRTYALKNGPARTNPTMSDDGRYVFFQSPVGLTPGALNEATIGRTSELAQNVYEYHEGSVSLISDGKDKSESGKIPARSPELLGTDASGENVFFATSSQLTTKDTDTQRDYYDARIGGGEETPVATAPCEGDGCREGGSVPPVFGPLTSTLIGQSGNLTGPGKAPGTSVGQHSHPTKAQLLAKALKHCRTKYKKRLLRAACERNARHRFVVKHKHMARPKRRGSKLLLQKRET